MNKFNLIKENNQIKLIKYFYSKDTRGNFSKIFSEDFFYKIGFKKKIAQINISTNLKKGTIRGFHYQKKPKNEQKLIICNKGKIIDVIIDLRKKLFEKNNDPLSLLPFRMIGHFNEYGNKIISNLIFSEVK